MRETVRAFIVGSYRSFFTITGITLSLVGTFLMFNLVLISHNMYENVRKDIRLEVFPGGNPAEISNRIKLLGGIGRVEVISSREAKEEFLNSYPDFHNLVENLGEDIFYTVIRVYPKDYWKEVEFLDMLSRKIKLIGGVSGVYYGKDWLKSASTFFKVILALTLMVSIITVVIAIVISFYTVRFVVSHRKNYVDILRLSGVSPLKLRFPYILLSGFYSVVSWFLASVLTLYTLSRFGILDKTLNQNIAVICASFVVVLVSCTLGAMQALRDIESGVV